MEKTLQNCSIVKETNTYVTTRYECDGVTIGMEVNTTDGVDTESISLASIPDAAFENEIASKSRDIKNLKDDSRGIRWTGRLSAVCFMAITGAASWTANHEGDQINAVAVCSGTAALASVITGEALGRRRYRLNQPQIKRMQEELTTLNKLRGQAEALTQG